MLFQKACALAAEHNINSPLSPLICLSDVSIKAAEHPSESLLIIRDYDHSDRMTYAQELAALCKKKGRMFLVAGDENIAITTEAAGMHLPEWQLHALPELKKKHPNWYFTCAAHDRASLALAEKYGASAALLSPVFATASHPEATPLTKAEVTMLVASVSLPVYGLGGVSSNNIEKLQGTGLAGVAGMRLC